ncbi:hypothetical protein [Bradyrhizobium sp. RDT46]|uniref:hypothetical protein n=1 Tax=Bradyrhizobium sp. RDT46 TaxID=3341829 RepID=UPI0035C7305E
MDAASVKSWQANLIAFQEMLLFQAVMLIRLSLSLQKKECGAWIERSYWSYIIVLIEEFMSDLANRCPGSQEFEPNHSAQRLYGDRSSRRFHGGADKREAVGYLFTGRRPSGHVTTCHYARLLSRWLTDIGLDPHFSERRTKATLKLRAVQLLLGHTKFESTVRYLDFEVDDAR